MSPQNIFSTAAQGQLPEQAAVASVVVMGKDMGHNAALEIAETLFQRATEDGVARPINALAANKVVTPGGGLAPKGNETDIYKYKGGEMFGIGGKG